MEHPMAAQVPKTSALKDFQGPYVLDGGQFSYSAIGNVLITSQNGDLTVDAMRRTNDFHSRVLARFPRGTCMISHLSTMKVPSPEVRKTIADALARYDATTLKRAIVLSEEGFVASIVRSVLAGMAAVDRTSTMQRYFSDLSLAAQFLADVAQPTGLGADAILQAAQATVEAHG